MKRIQYVDTLKALAIFTVVVGHVFCFTWNKYYDNIWNHLISAYNMPLFFFLSGIFAKDDMRFGHLRKKVIQLLLPYMVVGGIFAFMNDGLFELVFAPAKFGYWFLPALFVFFCLFYLRSIMVRLIKRRISKKDGVIVSFDVTFAVLCWLAAKVCVKFMPEDMSSLFCLNHVAYGHGLFFVAGFLFGKYHEAVEVAVAKKKELIYFVSMLGFLMSLWVVFYSGIDVSRIGRLILGMFSIPVLIQFFKPVTLSGILGKIVSFVGTHTLHIYVLHYFFIPKTYLVPAVFGGGKSAISLCG